MRAGLTVVGICLALSIAWAFLLTRQYSRDIPAVQDLMLGLIYYMEQNEGHFPPTQEAFIASPFVEQRPDGAIVISAPKDTNYRQHTHGVPIPDLDRYAIQWGADLAALEIDERERVRDAEGRAVELLQWPGSDPSGRGYTLILVVTQREILRGDLPAAATQPYVEFAAPDDR